MTLSDIRREARVRIGRNGQSHQEVLEHFLQHTTYSSGDIAGELAKIPSRQVLRETRTLKIVFVSCLGVLLAARLFSFLIVFQLLGLLAPVLVLSMLLSLATPILGIITAALNRAWGYQTVAILMTIGILRSLWVMLGGSGFAFANEGLLLLIPVLGAIVVGFMMPSRLKTPVLSIARYEFDPKKGREVRKYDYRFEEERNRDTDLLDADL